MLRFFTLIEKVLLVLLIFIVLGTSWYLYSRYITEHSELIASDGGIYTEGVVGRPAFLNPVLIIGNAVDQDITRLLFSGLTRFNPHTGLIEDDIATSERSKDNLTYTFTIVPDAKWHDGQAVVADDVVFTYQTVLQSEEFSNASLKQSFSDVRIEKIDDRKVSFTLKEPNSFFLANVTIGLLPKHHLEFVPISNLSKSEFNQNPVGSGPYRFSSWSVVNDTHEITLHRNAEYYAAHPKIQTVIFRAFPTESALLQAENTLSGFRLQNGQKPTQILDSQTRFQAIPYHLPQYSALFLNTDSSVLSNKKVRFALLLATNKDEIQEAVGDAEVVDTPILESKADLDIEFSLERAMGAFFDTEWNLPSKVKKDESDEEASGGPIEIAKIQESDTLTFVLEAVQDTWLSLRTDDSAIQSFLFKTGETKTFTVDNTLFFSTIGNAAGLKIEVNDIVLKSLGEAGVVLRNLSLDRTTVINYIDESVLPVEEPLPADDSESVDEGAEEEADELTETEEEELEVEEDAEEEVIPDPVRDELEKVRINDKGERLILRLVTAQEPSVFLRVAELVQKQWLEAGVKVVIETYSMSELQKKIQERDYDVLLFGQNLGYNLDAFPFWHSSQSDTGLNLSNYRSLEADNLLVDVRKTFDERTKQELLDRLKKIIAEDTPAVFLYNPSQFYIVDKSVKNVELTYQSNHSDRFLDLLNWYIKQDYKLKEDFSFTGMIRWMFSF